MQFDQTGYGREKKGVMVNKYKIGNILSSRCPLIGCSTFNESVRNCEDTNQVKNRIKKFSSCKAKNRFQVLLTFVVYKNGFQDCMWNFNICSVYKIILNILIGNML